MVTTLTVITATVVGVMVGVEFAVQPDPAAAARRILRTGDAAGRVDLSVELLGDPAAPD